MRLWGMQVAVVAFFLLVGWGATALPRIKGPSTSLAQKMCAKPADEVARGVCADLSAR